MCNSLPSFGLPKLERLRLAAYFAGNCVGTLPIGGIVFEPLSQHGAGRDVIKPFPMVADFFVLQPGDGRPINGFEVTLPLPFLR
jgi:hypothetical protein